jgi:hypothetical protein
MFVQIFIVKTNLIRIDWKFLTFSGIGTSARSCSRFSSLTITIGPFPFTDDVICRWPSVTSPNLCKKNWTIETNFRSAMLCLHLRLRLLRFSFWRKMKYQIPSSTLTSNIEHLLPSPRSAGQFASVAIAARSQTIQSKFPREAHWIRKIIFNLFANFLA